ncbi:FAD-dependent oxidoreductase [bacterium]|nr:FAD-dependent oxidoreductase [bacterium]MCI0607427.1 FAD-dependent oxidoreductase [bacterium]
MSHLVIIGNGITGTTVAREVRKRTDMRITVISNETDYFYARTALMYIYMGHMKFENIKPYEDWFWEKNRIHLVRGFVSLIDVDTKQIRLADGRTFFYDTLLVATGSQSNKFGWPGQDLPGVQGLYSIQDLELMEQNTAGISRAVIVGGGLVGIEVAEMLQSRGIPITFLVREENFYDIAMPRNEAQLLNRHIREHGIDLRLATQLKEILADSDGKARAVVTDSGEEISCQFVALTVGVRPNIDVVKNSKIESNRGVLVNEYLETNIPNIYAAGDCAEIKSTVQDAPTRVEQLWYTGRLQAEALAKTICGERTKYDRGIWFNSAKFFDIEWQTYGQVSNTEREGEKSFYWEHRDGKHCMRIVHRDGSMEVLGFNVMGIRFRQEVCQRWISEKRTVEYTLQNLRQANFDPEFFRQYEPEIVDWYNRQNPGKNLRLIQRSPWRLFRKNSYDTTSNPAP